jgi:hypothetical protein
LQLMNCHKSGTHTLWQKASSMSRMQ